MKIFYINYDGHCSVYDSQVYTFCKMLNVNYYKIYLINFEREFKPEKKKKLIIFKKFITNLFKVINKKFHIAKRCNKNTKSLSDLNYKYEADGIKIFTIKKMHKYDFIITNNYIKSVEKIIKSECVKNEKIILHCRGHFGAVIGIRTREALKNNFNIKAVSDIRGLIADEYLLRLEDKNILYKVPLLYVLVKIRKYERYICKKSDFIFCVSSNIKKHLGDGYNIKPGIEIIPTSLYLSDFAFDNNIREDIRKSLNIDDRFVVVYCGGGQKWQNIDGMAELFKKLKKQIPELFFLIISMDTAIFEAEMKEHKIIKADYTILSANHNDVCKYLSAGDCAFLIRKPLNLNAASSPTKFAEYISCRLPVIISHGIGSLDEIINIYKIGVFIEDVDNLKVKVNEIRNKANFQEVLDKYFTLDKNIAKITEVYKNI